MDKVFRVNSILETNKVNTVSKSHFNDTNTENIKTPFSKFLGIAIDNINDASETVKMADKMAVDFSLGRMDNPEELMIAQEKASLSINYATKITNKILDVYNEIMRMQI